MKLYLIVPFLFLNPDIPQCQETISLKGKITTLSKSTRIIFSGNTRIAVDVNSKGEFSVDYPLHEYGDFLIKTDSSANDIIWLEPGNYYIVLREIRYPGISVPLMRVDSLSGPKDAELLQSFSKTRYTLKGENPEITRQNNSRFHRQFLDSSFRNFPQSKALPLLISLSTAFLTDSLIKLYTNSLNSMQKESDPAERIEDYLQRQRKIKGEKFFQDFSMPSLTGEVFRLSEINAKLILIDFWASDCRPCRTHHAYLRDLYSKYHAKGLEIVSIALDRQAQTWQKAVEEDQMNWINVSDLKGWDSPIAKDYYISSIPYSFWLGKNRLIQKENSLTEEQLEKLLTDN